MDAADIERLIEQVKQTLSVQTNPEYIARLKEFLALLTEWLRNAPTGEAAEAALAAMLNWMARSGMIGVTKGFKPLISRLLVRIWYPGEDIGPPDSDLDVPGGAAEGETAAGGVEGGGAAAGGAEGGGVVAGGAEGGGAVAGGVEGGGAVAGGLGVGALLIAVGIGIGIGLYVGPKVEKAMTPPAPGLSALSTNCKVNGPQYKTTIKKCYWGSERSLVKTLVDAETLCTTTMPADYCSGPGTVKCTSGASCSPTSIGDPEAEQGWCWGETETTVHVTCVCGC